MPFPYHEFEGPPIAVPTNAPAPTLPPLKRSIHTNFGKPPDCLTLYTNISSINIPKTYKQAMEQTCWKEAMDEELQALIENHTWDLVPRPSDTSIIESKWVYTIKVKPDATLDRYKARMVQAGIRD